MCDGATPLRSLEGTTFVAQLEDSWIPLEGELLVTVFDNRICRIAYRERVGDSWSPPTEAELRQ